MALLEGLQKGEVAMILRKVRREGKYITSYTVSIGCQEARRAGFLNEVGSSKELAL